MTKSEPMGYPPKGMWYDPQVKEADDEKLPPEATYSVDWLITYPEEYFLGKKVDVTADWGFFDSPGDIGQHHSGDFPTTPWLPRGTEEANMSPNETVAAKEILPLKIQMDITSKYGPEYNAATLHYYTAVKNNHDKARSIEYAASELEKMKRPIDKTKLLEIIEHYLKGLE